MNIESSDLLELLLNQGDQTLQTFDEILAANPSDLEALLGRSAFLSKQKKYLEAIESYTQVIKIASGMDLANAYAGRSFNYYNLEEFQKSLIDCEQALELNPNESILWRTKAALLARLDQKIESLSALQKGLEINPHDQNMIGLKEIITELFQQKLEGYENSYRSSIRGIIEELGERWKFDSDELLKSDKFMEDILKSYKITSDFAENLFREIPFLFLESDKCLTIYYFIKAIDFGLNAVYPSFDKEKIDGSRNYFEKAKELAKNKDHNRMGEIVSIEYLLEKRFAYSEHKASKTSVSNNSSSGGNPSLIALGIGAFSIVLLIAGQWLIALIGIAASFWLFQSKS